MMSYSDAPAARNSSKRPHVFLILYDTARISSKTVSPMVFEMIETSHKEIAPFCGVGDE